MEIVEESRDAAFLNGHDDGLVRIQAAFSALSKEAVHDHAVPRARRDVEAVLAERTPSSGGELIDLTSQPRDALRTAVRS